MPRVARIIVEGDEAVYHIISRVTQQEFRLGAYESV